MGITKNKTKYSNIYKNGGRTTFQKHIWNVNMYCALVLGISPKHFILPAWADTKHSFHLFCLGPCFVSHGRDSKVSVMTWATAGCCAQLQQLSKACPLRIISSSSFPLSTVMFSRPSISKIPFFLCILSFKKILGSFEMGSPCSTRLALISETDLPLPPKFWN